MTARRLLLIDAGAFINAIDDAMSNPKMTPWFPGNVKPERVGEYNASHWGDRQARRWWNGRQWSEAYYESLPEASKEGLRRRLSISQAIPWRGLAKDPNDAGGWGDRLPNGNLV